MAKVEVYTADFCPYCTKAKTLLDIKGISYEEIDISTEDGWREKLAEISGGGKTVPQIIIDGQPIGGFTELSALNDSGELEKLVSA